MDKEKYLYCKSRQGQLGLAPVMAHIDRIRRRKEKAYGTGLCCQINAEAGAGSQDERMLKWKTRGASSP
jgi:hypothetical protein